MPAILHVSHDRLQAVLDLPAGVTLGTPDFAALCQQAGVCSGFQAEAMRAAMSADVVDRRLVVAQGQASMPPRPVRLHLEVALSELPMAIPAGACAGRFLSAEPGRPGLGVDGLAIATPESIASAEDGIHAGRGFDIGSDGRLIANRDGQLVLDAGGALHVVLPGINERELPDILVQVEFSAHQAWIGLRPGEFVAVPTLQAALRRARIAFGILPEALSAAARASALPRRLVVARGVQPVSGSAGRIEHLLDAFTLPWLEQLADCDIGQVARQCQVEAGTPLLLVVPSVPGQTGIDVHGHRLAAHAERTIDPQRCLGPGTRRCAEDDQLVEAAISGLYRRDGRGRVTVDELLIIPGDLDRAVGDLDTPLPVLVQGSIADGMRLKSGGDVLVLGSIGDARVSARGNLLVQGRIGPGEQRIKAHLDVLAQAVSGRQIKARRVAVLASITDATVLATDDVTTGEVIGGSIVAGKGLRCRRLGDGRPTRVEVGRNPLQEQFEQQARASLPELSREAAALRVRCDEAARLMNVHALDPETEVIDADLRALVEAYRRTIRQLAEARQLLHLGNRCQRRTPPSSTMIEVLGEAHAGVTLVFGEINRTIEALIHGGCFRVQDGGIEA